MSRPTKIVLIVLASLASLVVLVVIAAFIAVQTPWFRDYAGKRIVAELDKASGGHAQIGSLSLDIFHLSGEVRNFVLHGKGRPGQPPFARAKDVKVGARIVSVKPFQFALDHVIVDDPRIFIRVYADGSTNLPTPPPKQTPSNTDPIQTVLDLAIRRFEINHGLVDFNDRKMPLDALGENVRARMSYDSANRRYDGNLSIAPLLLQGKGSPLPVNVNLPFRISENRIDVDQAHLRMPRSTVELSASVADLNTTPSGQFQLFGAVSPSEVAASFAPSMVADLRRSPPLILRADADMRQNQVRIRTVRAEVGDSALQASGDITNLSQMDGRLRFQGNLVLGQLADIFNVASKPAGTVDLSGEAQLQGTSHYTVNARVDGHDIGVQAGKTRLSDIRFSTDVRATPELVEARDMRLDALGGTFSGRASLTNGKEYAFDGNLRGFDLKYLASTYGDERKFAWDGTLSGPVSARGNLNAKGTTGLIAKANLAIAPGGRGIPLAGRVNVAFDGPRQAIDVGNSYIALPHTRLDLSGAVGNTMNVKLVSRNLNDLLPAIAMVSSNPPSQLPVTLENGGAASFDGTVQGSLSNPLVTGHLAVNKFEVEQAKLDLFQADVSARQTGASVQNLLLTQGPASVTAQASIGLVKWKPQDNQPLNAKLDVRQARIAELLKMAGKPDVRLDGTLNASGAVSGTLGSPNGGLNATVRNGSVYDEPLNWAEVRVDYTPTRIELARANVDAGAIQLSASGAFDHQPGNLQQGTVQFQVATNDIPLAKVNTVQLRRSGLSGMVKLNAAGAATLGRPGSNPRIHFQKLNANLDATNLAMEGRPAGNIVATADTQGQNLVFKLRSNVAQSNIEGDGTLTLAGDYPLKAQVSFSPVRIGPLRQLISPPAKAGGIDVNGILEGGLTVNGPAAKPDSMRGDLKLTTFEITGRNAAKQTGQPETITIRNSGPLEIAMDAGQVRIRNAHFVGPSTDLALMGGVNLRNGPALDLQAKGNVGLGILHSFDPDIVSSGDIAIEASAQGPTSQPTLNGKLQLRNASLNVLKVSNGLYNANGAVVFNATEAVVQNITGETGGGKIAVAGFVRYGGVPEPEFRLTADAKQVRVRQGSGISVKSNVSLQLIGNAKSSTLAGNVTILEVAFYSHTDLGSVLSQAGAPPSAPSTQQGFLGGMRLDVRIDTSPGVQFITSLTQNLDASAHLRLRGTPSQPGMLGRIAITQGDIVFFGTKYTVNRGNIQFFDPQRILPVLDIDLEAVAKGVDVILSVNGPINRLSFNYRSDPPLEFNDLVALLAAGKVPTTDPVLAAQQPVQPQQSVEQVGASTLLGQAVANPVAGRLQQLFGVTSLKINPQITGQTNTPQASVTMEQAISKSLVVTITQDVTSSNPQLIRIEWAPDPTWSAIAVRDENGLFGVDVFYKRRFH